MSQALYRKYRSRSLDEIVGQEHITSLLAAAIARDHIAHAYLLTGPKGVGKTSIARILAHEINRLPYDDDTTHLDIIEIDAASNNSVEDVRELRQKIHATPSSARYKVYIIDEVHMLSKSAFNALLKTLEEPPEHAVFILATTDADKLPATIVSRVQTFNFRAISEPIIAGHLRTIADLESIDIADDALALIARHGQGAFRDSIGLLDQLRHASTGKIELANVQSALGVTDSETIEQLISQYRSGDITALGASIRQLEGRGTQAVMIANQLIDELHKQIAEHPNDLPVLDALLDVGQNSHPYVKLLTVLALNSPKQPPATSHQETPAKEDVVVSGKQPYESADSEDAPSDTIPDELKSNDSGAPLSSAAADSASEVIENEAAHTTIEQPTTSQSTTDGTFDWEKFIKACNGDVALRALLTKSGYKLEGDKLTIYAGSKFNAKQLDGAKQKPKVNAALQKIDLAHLDVVIKPEKAPPSDSQLADVAAIMGGGEQVEYSDGQ